MHMYMFCFMAPPECEFVPLLGRQVLSGNIAAVPIKEKAKFPQEFFPDVSSRYNVYSRITRQVRALPDVSQ